MAEQNSDTPAAWAGYCPVGAARTVRANRNWWDAHARDYHDEHGAFLGDCRLVWGPEGLAEDEAGLLGDVGGLDVLEVGTGGGPCSRWVAARGGRAVGVDLSAGMLAHARAAAAWSAPGVRLVQCDARSLPFADAAFDVAFSAYGAVPFVADPERIFAEVARVLRPGGRWVFSVTHPVRWAFPDDPGPRGLTVSRSYFDRTPYVEARDADQGAGDTPTGTVTYAEHHRTLGDRVRDVVGAGFLLLDVVEPEWQPGNDHIWGGWSPLRGALLPGTAIFVCRKP